MKKFVYISLLTVIIFSLFGGIVHAQNIPADPTEADITALTDYASGVNAGDIDISSIRNLHLHMRMLQ